LTHDVPGYLTETHLVTNEHATQIRVYPAVQHQMELQSLTVGCLGMRQGRELYGRMEDEGRMSQSEFAGLHAVERQDVIQYLEIVRKEFLQGYRLTCSIIDKLEVSPFAISVWSSDSFENTLSACIFCTESKAVLSGTRTS
jgi:hypothetical protein